MIKVIGLNIKVLKKEPFGSFLILLQALDQRIFVC